MSRSSILGEDTTFIIDVDAHDKIIGNAVKTTTGASYNEALNLLATVIRDAQPAPEEGFPILFLHRSGLVDALHQHTKLSKESIEIVLNGFSICKADMEKEGREVWKPKQEYRASRRAFFEMTHQSGVHLAFSRNMALEALNQLARSLVFRQIPQEWRSPMVDTAIANLSNRAGSWFETIVEEKLQRIGIVGLKSVKKQLGEKSKAVKIPTEVGEIDFLGYSEGEKFLLIAECKMVQGGFEGKFFRDDVKEFVTSSKSYLKKYSRKVRWLRDNISAVIDALESTGFYSTPVEPSAIATAIVTYYPTIAQHFIQECPCVSITTLILDYQDNNRWPYESGVYPLECTSQTNRDKTGQAETHPVQKSIETQSSIALTN